MAFQQKRVKTVRYNSLKRELSIDTTFDPPHFSLDSPLKLMKWEILLCFEIQQSRIKMNADNYLAPCSE